MSFLDGLLPASFRGIAFFVNSHATKVGRDTVVHEYPFRDTVWVEDLGRSARVFRFDGFLSDSGGGTLAKLAATALLLAAEKESPGTLTHPSLGVFTCALTSFTVVESKDALGVYACDFEFMQTGEPEYPDVGGNPAGQLSLGSLNLLDAGGSDLAATFLGYAGIGAGVFLAAPGVIQAFARIPGSLVATASGIVGSVRGLGAGFGRYDSGNLSSAAPDGSTPASLLAAGLASQQALALACAAAPVQAGVGDAADVAAAASTLAAAVLASAADPGDQINLLSSLAGFTAPPVGGTDAIALATAGIGQATATICRVSVLAQLALAVSAYQPTSYDDAVARQAAVGALFDAEALAAADAGNAATYAALRGLETVVEDALAQRGASLAPLRTWTVGASLPSLTLAQRFYEDGLRSDDLIARVDPIHPAFMPTSFVALAV